MDKPMSISGHKFPVFSSKFGRNFQNEFDAENFPNFSFGHSEKESCLSVLCKWFKKIPNAGKPEIDKKVLENRSNDPAGMQ